MRWRRRTRRCRNRRGRCRQTRREALGSRRQRGRAALRAAHVPAHAAGFGVLQDFLERGFAAFRNMSEAAPLLRKIRERETQLMEQLFSGGGEELLASGRRTGGTGDG